MLDLNQAMHIVGGASEAGCLKRALHLSHDQVLINEDPLSCGPAPATADLGVWRSARERYLSKIFVEWPDFSFREYVDIGLLMNAERLDQEQAIAVWAGLGLPDQLLLAWVVFLFDRLNLDLSKLAIIQFEKLRPAQYVLSLGELSPENIRKYRPAPLCRDMWLGAVPCPSLTEPLASCSTDTRTFDPALESGMNVFSAAHWIRAR